MLPQGLTAAFLLCFTSPALAVVLLVAGRRAERRSLRLLPFLQAIQRTLLKVTQKRVCVIGLVCSVHFLRLSVLAPLPLALWEELKGMFFRWVYSVKKPPASG